MKKLPDYLSIKNNVLYYKNINLLDLVKRYPSPLEVAYTDIINEKILYIKSLFKEAIIKYDYKSNYYYAYASKANYYSEVVSTSLNYADCIETSSAIDLEIILNLFNKNLINKETKIICNGFKFGYYLDKIIKLKKLGLNIIPILDNDDEVQLFLSQNLKFEVGLRLNIDDEYINTFLNGDRSGSAIDTRFGFQFDDMINQIEKINNSSNLKFTVFHFHMGGTICNLERYLKFISNVYKNYYCKLKLVCNDLNYFDFGGGLPVQYNLDFSFDYKKLVYGIVKNIKDISKQENIIEPNLIGEHGRYTVADHGFFIDKIVITKKSSQDSLWYLINSSFMNFLPDSWALGQEFIILPINLWENYKVKVKLGGMTCDPDDTYYKQENGNFIYLPEIKENQELYIGIFGVGAYQEMIAGVGGVHHCLTQEGNELIISGSGDNLIFNNISILQQSKEVLSILGYNNSHNLLQYNKNYKYSFVKFDRDDIKSIYNKLLLEFPKSEVFPYKNIQRAYSNKQYSIIYLKLNEIHIGTLYIVLLKKTKTIVINYIWIEKKYRGNGFGHILINKLKSYYKEYKRILVEVEPSDGENYNSIKNKRLRFYEQLEFECQTRFDYKILDPYKKTFFSMKLYISPISSSQKYKYSYFELKNILNEYFRILFEEEYFNQYKLNKI